jgi:histidinol-phosphatase (PHP family)
MVSCITMHDYHLHTPLCKHAEGTMDDYIRAALEKGITEVCFSDLMPFPNGFNAEHRMSMEDVETYMDQINLMKRKYREISVLFGIEVDYIEGYERYIEKFLDTYSFDLVIMSVHYMPKWPKGQQWVFDFEYTRQTLKKQCREYFNTLLKGIKTGLFDVVGHFDLVKRPRHSVLDTNAADVIRVLETIRREGMSLELNTSGLRRSIKETYPALDIVELAVNRGISIVFGSDAHRPENVGFAFDELFNTLFQLPELKLAHYQRRNCSTCLMEQPENDVDWSG